ncbi:MAG TPA: FAD/NAD(P)-binding protein, partial [Allosphingosinicella sp.]|nr:FAD/NAD(P)-binding protein [Allosphingosinicella sp.]
MTGRRIAIVGGGYAGTSLAIELLRHPHLRVTLIERAERPARGAAYRTAFPDHLLNVRAEKMSAFADQPTHFADWLKAQGAGDGATFAERRLYGRYLEEALQAAIEAAGDRLEIIRDEAVAIDPEDGERITLASGRTVAADDAILSVGNLPPAGEGDP